MAASGQSIYSKLSQAAKDYIVIILRHSNVSESVINFLHRTDTLLYIGMISMEVRSRVNTYVCTYCALLSLKKGSSIMKDECGGVSNSSIFYFLLTLAFLLLYIKRSAFCIVHMYVHTHIPARFFFASESPPKECFVSRDFYCSRISANIQFSIFSLPSFNKQHSNILFNTFFIF